MVFNFRNILIVSIILFFKLNVQAQSDATILIDGKPTIFRQDLSLPYWLKSGQVINIGMNVSSISVIEFTIDSTNQNLVFSQVLSITKSSVVPRNKTWKIEALGFNSSKNIELPPTHASPKTYNIPGIYYWIVPPTVNKICVELWGSGGVGGGADLNVPFTGAGGGGGAYGYQCIDVIPGVVYRIKVPESGGDSSVFGNLLYATGGTSAVDTIAGIGGKSNASFNVNGLDGKNTGKNKAPGKGGDCPLGGSGSNPADCGGYNTNAGLTIQPGGGGNGATLCGNRFTSWILSNGGGGNGKIIIYW